MHGQSAVTTHLFTDIEGSTRLWEQEPERMRPALARHDALTREAVETNRGKIVKTTGDGFHAVFDDPLDALAATLQLQISLAGPDATHGIPLRVRSGLHAGVDERRDNDFFGSVVNRAARIMNSAHGGQILVSQAVVVLIADRLPKDVAMRNLGRVRLRDLSGAELVYQIVHPKLRQDFPALRSLEATPNNLPQQLTSFIGREKELREVAKLLRATRLLTLLGVGGLGKTRLSIELGAEVMDDFPDGVWFVELASLADESLVPQAVASVLGVKEEAGHPVLEALVKYLRDRHLLIVLDNCEHLLLACAATAKVLLQAGANTKVLTSSREPLRLMSETTYHILPLSVPDSNERATVASLLGFEAVQLFVSRAAAVQSGFGISDQNAPAIAQICHRLDGIPLALELAAARVRSLSVDTIAARLSDQFRLLTRGDRTALPRQQTLRALIDWSYELLTERERTLLRRLAVFVGGWSLDAAENVGAGDEVARSDVVDLLTGLVDKSLVALEAQGERYRMLEIVRAYAQERLDESGEGNTIRRSHLAFYCELVALARQHLFGPTQGEWFRRLDLERENLLVAHAWCDHIEDGATLGLQLAYSVKPYWINRGLLGLGHRVTVEAITRKGTENRNIALCRGLFDAGQLCCFMGRYAEAQQYLEESLSIARELEDNGRIAMALQPLGLACLGQANIHTARSHLNEAVALAEKLGNKRELAGALNGLAQLHRVALELDAAEPLYQEVLALARELGDHESVAIAFLNLAMVAIERGSQDRARELILDVLPIIEETGAKRLGESVFEVSAGLAVLLEQWKEAARFFGAAEAQAEATGLHRDPGDEAFLLPLVAKARNALGAAFSQYEAAGRASSYEEAMAEARAWLKNAS